MAPTPRRTRRSELLVPGRPSLPDTNSPTRPCSDWNFQALSFGIPGRVSAELLRQQGQLGGDGFGLPTLGPKRLEVSNHGGESPHSNDTPAFCLDYKDKRLVVALDLIDGIVVDKVADAVQDWPLLVDLDASKNVAGVPKHDVRAGVDEAPGETDVGSGWPITPVRAPM